MYVCMYMCVLIECVYNVVQGGMYGSPSLRKLVDKYADASKERGEEMRGDEKKG